MSVIIPRNVTIPVTKNRRFYTSFDDQTEVDIQVYQGESSYVGYNHLLGEFKLLGVPKAKAGKESIDVMFQDNQNDMLQVTATIVSTKKCKKPLASDYRSVIRRTEKWLKQNEDLRVEELLHNLKCAIINSDEDLADTIAEQLRALCTK